jgi:hypothetical protein
MLYFLDFMTTITDLQFWIVTIIVVFIVVLLIYLIASIGQDKNVITSSAVEKSKSPAVAEQIYYLPTASVLITATAKVSIMADSTGEIQEAQLQSMKLEHTVNYEADTSQLYKLNYQPSVFANDEIRINTNSSGLLENVFASTEDTIGNIVATLSEAPKNILHCAWMPEVAEAVPPEHITIQIKEYTNTFTIRSNQWSTGEIVLPWIIYTDGMQTKPVSVDATCTLTFPAITIQHLDAGSTVQGLLTRPLKKVVITADANIRQSRKSIVGTYEISIPDSEILLNVPVRRTAFVKKIHTPKFQQGFLTENFINKPSEAEGAISIPINILKAIFSIPAQLLSFRIFHHQQETALLKAKLELEKARQAAAQQETQQQLNNATKDLQATNQALNELADKIKESAPKSNPEQTPPRAVPTSDDLKDAINKYQKEWKKKYQVIDIGIGKKKINGVESNIDALVFKPIAKLDHGKAVFVPIPPVIPYRSKDGVDFDLPTDVQQTGGPVVPAFIANDGEACNTNIPKRPGCSISRLNNDDTGTIGLKVFKGGKSYILSCYHVLCSTELQNRIFDLTPTAPAGDRTVICPGKKDQGNQGDGIGMVMEGKFHDFMDCAIAALNDDVDVEQRICRIDQEPAGIIVIGTEHTQPRLKVFMSGRTSGFRDAKIKSPFTSTDITYSIGKVTLSGLIATTPLAQEGDSGAVVFDEDCNVVGIVVARSPSDTYIIPIERILTEFQIQLKP